MATATRPGRGALGAPVMRVEEPRIGDWIAGCRIESVLGVGGMGVVYLAEQERLGRKVALKVVKPELAADARFRARFEQEARLTASIDHPHVIPVYQAGDEDGVLSLLMRYVEGTDLRELIALEGPLEPRRAARLVAQVASALDAAHEAGLIHRDVKPANVLVDSRQGEEYAYLSDFGLTKAVESTGEPTKSGQVIGTLDYIAPEQIEGRVGDGRTDGYALGCVLFEALTGRVPFERGSDAARMWAHMHDEPPSVQAINDELERFDVVIRRALAKAPEDRYETAGALGRAAVAAAEGWKAEQALAAAGGGRRARSSRNRMRDGGAATVIEEPEGATAAPVRKRRLPRRIASGVALVALLAAGGAAVLVVLGGRSDSSPEVARGSLSAARTAVVSTSQAADRAGKLDEVRQVGVTAQERLGIVERALRDAGSATDARYRFPTKTALTAERDYLTALASLSAMRNSELTDWKGIRGRLEVAQQRVRAATPRVTSLRLTKATPLIPAVSSLTAGTDSLDRLIRRAATKLKRWQRRVNTARAAASSELAGLQSYAGTMRGYLSRYSTLRAETQTLSDQINAGASYEEAYQGLGGARAARVEVKNGIDALTAPGAMGSPQTSVSSVIGESINAIDDAISGIATYQADVTLTYPTYKDTPGWQRFVDASSRISGEFNGARGRWETSMNGQLETVNTPDLPPRPDV